MDTSLIIAIALLVYFACIIGAFAYAIFGSSQTSMALEMQKFKAKQMLREAGHAPKDKR